MSQLHPFCLENEIELNLHPISYCSVLFGDIKLFYFSWYNFVHGSFTRMENGNKKQRKWNKRKTKRKPCWRQKQVLISIFSPILRCKLYRSTLNASHCVCSSMTFNVIAEIKWIESQRWWNEHCRETLQFLLSVWLDASWPGLTVEWEQTKKEIMKKPFQMMLIAHCFDPELKCTVNCSVEVLALSLLSELKEFTAKLNQIRLNYNGAWCEMFLLMKIQQPSELMNI